MPFAFLSPLLLAAAGLVVVPWILHHIRRPERELVRFSSLLFVPEVKREVIERRRLQHLLLMLLRMLVLLLLAWAFARPYIPLLAGAAELQGGARHVVLLDASYSVGSEEVFTAAKTAARNVVDALSSEDRIAVAAFDTGFRLLAPFGNKTDARLAIESARPTMAATDYEAALRAAARLFAEEGLDLEEGAQSIHLVTDFQRAGMPKELSGWKLPAAIEFKPVDLGAPERTWSIQDVNLRTFGADRFEIRVKVKHWGESVGPPAELALMVDGAEAHREALDVEPGNASLVRMDFAAPRDRIVEGWVEIAAGAESPDQRRFFTWNPDPKTHVLILGNKADQRRWPPASLLAFALPDTPDSPWAVALEEMPTPALLAETDVVVLADLSPLGAGELAALQRYLEEGGRALITLDAEALGETLRSGLLAPLGIAVATPRFPEVRESQFALLSWIDFEDPVFKPFQGARFNDFSDIHFMNHHLLEVEADHRVLARFETDEGGEGAPAILEIERGEGRAVLWAFPIDFAWTNFPRTARFVPILHETLLALAGTAEVDREWTVGERPTPPESEWEALVAEPGGEPTALSGALLARTGFLRWVEAAGEPARQSEPVNVDPEEADPARVSPAEFALRLCSAPIVSEELMNPEVAGPQDQPVNAREFGRYLLAAILAALALETWYAARLK